MTDARLGRMLGGHVKPMRPADEKAARAAMGIPDDATIMPMDMSQSPLFVAALIEDGQLHIIARASIPKLEAVNVLRQVADAWEREAAEEDES